MTTLNELNTERRQIEALYAYHAFNNQPAAAAQFMRQLKRLQAEIKRAK